LSGEKIYRRFQACFLKAPCDNKAISTVISFAAKNRRTACGYVAIASSQELEELRSSVFHQLQAGNAVALRGEAVHFPHFGSGESFHERFTKRSEHPAAADINDLSSNIFSPFGSKKGHGGGDVFDGRRTPDWEARVANAASLFQSQFIFVNAGRVDHIH